MNPLRLACLCVGVLALAVQSEVTFTAKAERTKVALGEAIRITATLVSTKSIDTPTPPRLKRNEHFTVVRTSQNQSSQSSVQIINGRAHRSTQTTYFFYYTIAPKKVGTFTFPALTTKAGGQAYTTKPFTIRVVKEPVHNPDVSVRLSVSKRKPYLREQIILTARVAHKPKPSVRLTGQGFGHFVERLEEELRKHFSLVRLTKNRIGHTQEQIGGELHYVYRVRLALFPLRQGSIRIDGIPFEYDELRQSQNRSIDPFRDFFGGSLFGSRVQARPRTVTSNPLSLRVRGLPQPPEDFSGAVGTFTLSAEISPDRLPAGEAATLKLTLRGNTRPRSFGEIHLPELPGCEVFAPEEHSYVDTTKQGIGARRVYKYLIVPREQGTTKLPPIEWTYMDPRKGSYRTLRTEEFVLEVSEGKEGVRPQTRYLTQEEIQEVGRDIRYIKTPSHLRDQAEQPYRNPLFALLYPIPFVMALFSLLFRVQAHRHEQDAAKTVRKRAFSRASRRLRHLRKGEGAKGVEQFLGELYDTIEEYIRQRFSFAAGGKTIDELAGELRRRGVDEQTLADLRGLLEKTDEYRFGGGAGGEAMETTMRESALELLKRLERCTTKRRTA